MSSKGNYPLGLTLACLALVGPGVISGCKPSSAETPKDTAPPVAVQVVQPKRGLITRNVTLPVEVKGCQQAKLYAEVVGQVMHSTCPRASARFRLRPSRFFNAM